MSEKLESAHSQRMVYSALHTGVNGAAKVLFGFKVYNGENVPAEDGVILAADHRAWSDPIVVSAAVKNREVRHVSKHEWFEVPVLAQAIEYFKALPIHRDNPTEYEVKAIVRALKDGEALGIFVDKTRRLKDRWGKQRAGEDLNAHAPVQPGSAIFARMAKVPTVPVVITGTDSVHGYLGEGTIWDPLVEGHLPSLSRRYQKFTQQSVWAAMFRHKVNVLFGEPMDYPVSIASRKDYIAKLDQTLTDLREEGLSKR